MGARRRFPTLAAFLFLIAALTRSSRMEDSQPKDDANLPGICGPCSCKRGDHYLVDCSGRDLTIFPAESGWAEVPDKLSSLYLYLDDNSLTFVPRMSKPRSLTHLSLRHNYIDTIASKAFCDLRNLTVLDLAYNSLDTEALQKEVFEGPFSKEAYQQLDLVKLDLSYNKLHSLSKDTFDHIEKLQELVLDGNLFKVIDHQTSIALTTLMNLRSLSLANMMLSEFPSTFFSSFKKLSVLNLTNNKFTVVPPQLFFSSSLTSLTLNGNPITQLDRISFTGISNLRKLYMKDMPELRYIGEESLGQLDKLEILYCSYNPKLSTIHPLAFQNPFTNISMLREVHLRNNSLKSLDPSLMPWKQLSVFDVQENPFTCDCRIKWMFDWLLHDMLNKLPQETLLLRCASPPSVAGVFMVQVPMSVLDVCLTQENATSRHGVRFHHLSYTIPSQANLVAVLLLTTLAIVVTVAGIMWTKRKKIGEAYVARQQVRYRKARMEDEYVDV